MHSEFTESSFNLFVTSALFSEANKAGKPVLQNYKFSDNVRVDLFFPEGLPILQKDTKNIIVEIQYNLNEKKLRNYLDKCLFNNYYLIIITKNFPDFNHTSSSNFKILGDSFIEQLSERNPTSRMISKLSENDVSIISKTLNGKTNIYLQHNNTETLVESKTIDDLTTVFENEYKNFASQEDDFRHIALILGNGVSIPYGACSWDVTVNTILNSIHPEFIESPKRIEDALSDSQYLISSFVKKTLNRKNKIEKFYDVIRKCLYDKYKGGIRPSFPSLATIIADYKFKNTNVPILTYNYDTFVEREYGKKYNKDLFYYSGTDYKNHIRNSIIHLHGYVSYNLDKRKDIVLTDEDYFESYFKRSSRRWVYNAQKEILENYNVLFVGSSMSDLFQLSIIDDVSKRKPNWYCYALMCFEVLSEKEKVMIIRYYLDKKIKVIDVNNFDELPSKLYKLLNK